MIRLMLLATLLLAAPALGAQCRLEDAVYTQPDSTYAIRFHPVAREASSSVSNWFRIEGLEGGRIIHGEVFRSSGYGGPMTTLSLDCAPDAAGPMPVECAIWENFIYVIGDGTAEPLPRGSEAAPATILLPTFGRTIYDRWSTDMSNVPADLFFLEACEKGIL